MMGAVFQYFAEVTGEKVTAAQARAVARGVLPNSRISPGYMRGEDGVLVVERPKAPDRRAGIQAPRPRRLAGGDPGVPGRVRDRAVDRRRGVDAALADVPRRDPFRRAAQHASAHEPIIKDRALFERVQRRTVSRGRQAKSERLLARLGVLRCGTCGSRMVINSYSGNYRCGDTSANPCQRRAAVKADRVEKIVLDAVRAYSATADVHGRASRKQQIREADEAIERANADLDDTIRQLGELGLLGRPASQQTLGKLTTALDDAHTARARLGDQGASDVIGPDEIDKLREPAKRLAAWRRLITDTVESVTVAPAMTADGRPSRLWDPRRIDIRFLGQPPYGSRQRDCSRLPSTPAGRTTRTTLPTVAQPPSSSGTTSATARNTGRSASPVWRDPSAAAASGVGRGGCCAREATATCACKPPRVGPPASTSRLSQPRQGRSGGASGQSLPADAAETLEFGEEEGS